jgi:lipid-A-disaccharide synthase
VHKIAQVAEQVLGIFPFEPAFYAQYGYQCEYVGNPVADSIRTWKKLTPNPSLNGEESAKAIVSSPHRLIAILPGSRKSEISKCLPTMLAAARKVSGDQYQIVVTAAPGIDDAFYTPYLQGEKLTKDTYTLLAQAHAAVVNSGTATLETALIGCPQTAVYHVAGSKYLEKLLKPIMFSIKYFTLVNIIPDKEVIQELVASRFTQENVEQELRRLLEDEPYRAKMKQEYEAIWQILGEQSAAQGAARVIESVGGK